MSTQSSILVIRHGALGDIVLSTSAFAAIRKRHPDAWIVCLTNKAYAELMAQTPYFNEIWVDSRPRPTNREGIRRLRKMLRSRSWEWVYDIQTSKRSTIYQWLLPRPWPNISNVSRFASHGYTDPARHGKHSLENTRLQLAIAGIPELGPLDLSWLTGDISALKPQGRSAILVPGGSAHRPEKRWPAEQYASLAQELVSQKITPILIGTDAEAQALDAIVTRVPQAVSLRGKTSFGQLAELARGAVFAIGNDTGPMHITAAVNCPSVVIFSHASNPDYAAPIGTKVKILRERDLRNLSVDQVLVAANRLA